MLLKEFSFDVPRELISQEPRLRRDHARLMVYDRKTDSVEHRIFKDLPSYLNAGDALIINNTRVMPVRLFGKKTTGGVVEALLIKKNSEHEYECYLRPAVPIGNGIIFDKHCTGVVRDRKKGGVYTICWEHGDRLNTFIEKSGYMPLPPYIKRAKISASMRQKDITYYQTVYALHDGSIAAPTAGLHFTEELLAGMKDKGVNIIETLLHVGVGTFKKIIVSDIGEHRMEKEFYRIPAKAAHDINAVHHRRGRIIAVGTTVVRTLEFSSSAEGEIITGEGWADIFITPGYRFKAVDGIITNFHLPQYPPFVMIASFVGLAKLKELYTEAIKQQYKFYSYGDAMLIL